MENDTITFLVTNDLEILRRCAHKGKVMQLSCQKIIASIVMIIECEFIVSYYGRDQDYELVRLDQKFFQSEDTMREFIIETYSGKYPLKFVSMCVVGPPIISRKAIYHRVIPNWFRENKGKISFCGENPFTVDRLVGVEGKCFAYKPVEPEQVLDDKWQIKCLV